MTFHLPLTRRDAVIQQLREEIIDGVLKPGEVIKDAELAARLQLSITPVREAIAQLAMEGLIETSPNRSKRVATLTKETAIELAVVMELLAGAGFAWGVEHLTEEDLEDMRQSLAAMHDAVERNDVKMASKSGIQFANRVIQAGGNQELMSHLELIYARFQRVIVLRAFGKVWPVWRKGFSLVLETLEKSDRKKAVIYYKQTLADFVKALSALEWPGMKEPEK